MKRKGLLIVVALVFLMITLDRTHASCSTEVVYPLLYGTGTWDLFINDIASFSSGDILVGGKSLSTKSAGEGFTMRIDKYGSIKWQRIYQSTETGEDSVDRVAVSNDYSFAVGHSYTGSSNKYFLLKFASDGTAQYNAQVSSDPTKIGPDSIITNFIALSDTTCQIFYDGNISGVHRIMASFITLDGSSAESMFGLSGISNGALIRTIIMSATATTIFSIYNSKLFLVYFDSNNAFGTQAKYVTNDLNTLNYATYKNDMDLKSDNSEGWMAVISTDNKIYGFSTTIGQVNSLTMANSFSISGFSSAPVFITVMYIDITHCIITTMLTDGSGVIIKVDQSTNASPTLTSKKIAGLSNGKFIGYKLSTGFLFASSKIGGESASLTKSQGAIYKSADDLTFGTYNCYEVTASETLTIAKYTLVNASLGFGDLLGLAGYIKTDSTGYVAGTASFISTSTGIEIRAESTKQNTAASAYCKLQPITASYSATSYAVSSSAADVSLLTATQCQSAPLKYTATVTGEASLPSWIVNTPTTPVLTLKPSLVRSSTYLKANTITIVVSDKNAVPQTATGTLVATFTNTPPSLANAISSQTMYKGMGAKSISVPANTFSDTDTLTYTVSNNLSGVTPSTFSLSGTTLSVTMPNSYAGTFTATVTASDYCSQTATATFNIVVNSCSQSNCDYCTGTSSTDCTQCMSGFTKSNNVCTAPQTSSGGSSSGSSSSNGSSGSTNGSTTSTSSYLNRDVTSTSAAGVGTPIAAATIASVGMSAVTGSSPIVAGLGISQCQNIQAISMFNMNTPDNYVSYSQGYEITKLNIKFINGIGLQDALMKGTRRNLSTGFRSLSNIGFSSGNFFVNYIYFFLLLLLMIIVHLLISLMLACCTKKNSQSKCRRCLLWTKSGFEFSWYLNLFFFASLFIFILSLNDMAGNDTSTGLNVFSLILSIIFFIFMVKLMLFPLFIVCKDQSKIVEIIQTKHNERRFIEKIIYNYTKGFKTTRIARLYYLMFILRRLILAIVIIGTTYKAAQLIVYIISNFVFIIYVMIARPFLYKTQNFICLFNEIVLQICCFLMFGFFGDGKPKDGIGIAMIVLFSFNIIVCFTLSFVFQIYLYCSKRKPDTIDVVKDGEVVRYQTQKPMDEVSFSKDDIEAKTKKDNKMNKVQPEPLAEEAKLENEYPEAELMDRKSQFEIQNPEDKVKVGFNE